MLVLTVTAAATAGAVLAWIADRRRSSVRNAGGQCGACGTSWAKSGEPYLIHGRLVCEECAAKARRRMPWELGALAGWAALVAAIGLGNVFAGNVSGVALIVGVPAVIVPLGAVHLMKRANLQAQRKLAAGELTVRLSENGESRGSLTDGSAV